MIDTIDIGSLTKKIRLSKKLSLKDVAGDYLSVSFLSKFERGESEISLLSKDNPTRTEELLARVSKAFQQNNIPALKKYYYEEIEKFNSTHKKIFLYNSILIDSFLISITGKKMNKKHIEVISDYLFDVDQWVKRELVILGIH